MGGLSDVTMDQSMLLKQVVLMLHCCLPNCLKGLSDNHPPPPQMCENCSEKSQSIVHYKAGIDTAFPCYSMLTALHHTDTMLTI